jgi:hypothetical protein
LENDLFDLWSDAVVYGAISRICSIPGQPFSDLVVSAAAASQAARLGGKARVEGSFNRVRGQMRVAPRKFA